VRQAVEHIAVLFQRYSREGLEAGWKSDLTLEEQRRIEQDSIWQLPEQVVRFAGSDAALLYGSAYDFKFFLPRLLLDSLGEENLSQVMSHARAVGLMSWPKAERDALGALVCTWWIQCLNRPVDFNSWPAEDALCAAALLNMDLSPFLKAWRVDTGLNAKLQLLETIRFLLSATEDALDLGAYWEACPTQAEQVRTWLLSEEVLDQVRGALLLAKDHPERQLLEQTVQRFVRAGSG